MYKAHKARMQANASVGIGTGRTVLQISLNGTSHFCLLTAYLMMPPRFQVYFQQIIVQGDKTGDTPLSETVKLYLKEKYQKPGNVFIGVTHRLDRPVSGLVVFAKTSKALARLNEMFRNSEVKKTYWAVVKNRPRESEGELVNYLVRNEKQNKSYAYDKEVPNSKKAILHYRLIARSQNYYLLEIDLKTGRHHQIRCQLAKMGCPIKGDLKYGSPRSNPDGSISCMRALCALYIRYPRN